MVVSRRGVFIATICDPHATNPRRHVLEGRWAAAQDLILTAIVVCKAAGAEESNGSRWGP